MTADNSLKPGRQGTFLQNSLVRHQARADQAGSMGYNETMNMSKALNQTGFSPAGQQVADYLKNQPWKAAGMTLQDIAAEVFVSPATVLRVVRKCGYDSWRALQRVFCCTPKAPGSSWCLSICCPGHSGCRDHPPRLSRPSSRCLNRPSRKPQRCSPWRTWKEWPVCCRSPDVFLSLPLATPPSRPGLHE